MLSESYDLEHNDSVAACQLLDELCVVYADAYGVEPGEKVEAFAVGRGRRSRRLASIW